MNKWCNTGEALLDSRPTDGLNSSEGAEIALEEIENLSKSPQGMNMTKVRKMTPMSNALGNKTLISKVKESHKRINKVNEMLAKRETRYSSQHPKIFLLLLQSYSSILKHYCYITISTKNPSCVNFFSNIQKVLATGASRVSLMAMGQVYFPSTMSMTPLYFNGKAEPKTLSENQQVAWCPASLLSYHTQCIEY